jgi:predicted  nucleic acid-binding Zn-ribbon protein
MSKQDVLINDETMHHDHRQWESDVSMWRDDIEIWQQNHQNALKELNRIAERLTEHMTSLEAHVGQLDSHEANTLQHEHGVAADFRQQNDPTAHSMSEHVKEATRHQHLRDAHERMKKHHHTVMAHIAMLKATLDSSL